MRRVGIKSCKITRERDERYAGITLINSRFKEPRYQIAKLTVPVGFMILLCQCVQTRRFATETASPNLRLNLA